MIHVPSLWQISPAGCHKWGAMEPLISSQSHFILIITTKYYTTVNVQLMFFPPKRLTLKSKLQSVTPQFIDLFKNAFDRDLFIDLPNRKFHCWFIFKSFSVIKYRCLYMSGNDLTMLEGIFQTIMHLPNKWENIIFNHFTRIVVGYL